MKQNLVNTASIPAGIWMRHIPKF